MCILLLQDDARPYLSAARDLYRDLVTVGKDPVTGKIVVQSFVYDVTGLVAAAVPPDGSGSGPAETAAAGAARGGAGGAAKPAPLALFPNSSPLNCCWVVVHPARYQVAIYYFPWVPFW